MFDTEIESGPSILAWVIQQLAAPLLPMTLTLVAVGAVGDATRAAGYAIDYYAAPVVGGAFWVAPPILGYGLGTLVRRLAPSAARVGRWVWVIPVAVLVLACVGVALGHREDLLLLVWPRSGEEAWGYVLVTGPTLAAVAYSLAMGQVWGRLRRFLRSTRLWA